MSKDGWMKKFIEVVSGAIGKVFEPRHIRNVTDAKVYEINAISEALRENSDVAITFINGEITADTSNTQDFVQRTKNRITYQELLKQQNIEVVADKAYGLLSEEAECSEDPVDKDWIIRFFNSVEDVSDADMQFLWAKILAGEIKRPKSFSLRTLETLKNLSKDEAVLFEKICKLKIVTDSDTYFPNYPDYRSLNGVTYDELMLLSECGLITLPFDVVCVCEVFHDEDTVIAENKNIKIVARSRTGKNEEIDIKIFPFTKIGIEISKLFENEVSDEILLTFAKIVRGDLKGANITPISSKAKISAYKINDTKNERDLLA